MAETGHWSLDGWICNDDLQAFRHMYVQGLLQAEQGELTELEREVSASLHQQELRSRDPEVELPAGRTLGRRLADRIAGFGGSWRFIGIFGGVLFLWIPGNSLVLLYLVLSCLAAVQAPVIMMSQGRQELCDRLHAQRDYQVNATAR